MILAGYDKDIRDWVNARMDDPVLEDVLGFGVTRNDELIAGIIYYQFRGTSCEVSMAADSPRWISKEIVRTILGLPYQMGMERITALVRKSNKRSRKLVEGLGFKNEGTIRYPKENLILYGLLEKEFKEKWNGKR